MNINTSALRLLRTERSSNPYFSMIDVNSTPFFHLFDLSSINSEKQYSDNTDGGKSKSELQVNPMGDVPSMFRAESLQTCLVNSSAEPK